MLNIERGAASDSIYVQFSDEPISHSVELSPEVIIDVAEDNTVVGVDIQYVSDLLVEPRPAERPAASANPRLQLVSA